MEGWDICCYDQNREPADCELFYNFRRIATTRCFVPRFVGKTSKCEGQYCGKFMHENKISYLLQYTFLILLFKNVLLFPFN